MEGWELRIEGGEWGDLFLLCNSWKMERKYEIRKESLKYSLMILGCYKYLVKQEKEYVLSKQLLRSWTSIWANIMEAQEWQSKKDFLHKMSIALKEARESEYWIELLKVWWYLQDYEEYSVLLNKTDEILWTLTNIVKTTKLSLL